VESPPASATARATRTAETKPTGGTPSNAGQGQSNGTGHSTPTVRTEPGGGRTSAQGTPGSGGNFVRR
jgi:hypothetical protein